MKISVVTPVLNGEKFIQRTIESVLSQSGNLQIEYIIKDGESTDRTLQILDGYQHHPEVMVISKPDTSLYDAINQGFEHATGDIGCWINADDFYEPNTFQKAVDAFKKHPDREWLYGRCDIIDENENEIRKPITWYKNLIGWNYSHNMLYCENYINQPATFWKMDLWKRVGGLSNKYKIAADYHLWLKFAQESKATALHQKLAHFRRCGESISDNQFEAQFDEGQNAAQEFAPPLPCAIHRFNCWKTKFVYRMLR